MINVTTTTAPAKKFSEYPQFAKVKASLTAWVESLGKKTFAEVFASQVDRGAAFSYQTVATLVHTSAGAIRDKWMRYKDKEKITDATPADVEHFILGIIAPLTAEELAEQKRQAVVLQAATTFVNTALDFVDLADITDEWLAHSKSYNKLGDDVKLKVLEVLEQRQATAKSGDAK